jgi:WhiB family transcriptional regulator, redox-sensing transcriptional regulator
VTTMIEPLTATDRAWRMDADCRYQDPELFFPNSYTSPEGLIQVDQARQICRFCPVLAQCHADAARSEGSKAPDGRHGIRAAMTPNERHAEWRRNNRNPAAA